MKHLLPLPWGRVEDNDPTYHPSCRTFYASLVLKSSIFSRNFLNETVMVLNDVGRSGSWNDVVKM